MEKTDFSAVQTQTNWETYLISNISRREFLQLLLNSHFLQDDSSLSHALRKLQASGHEGLSPQTEFTEKENPHSENTQNWETSTKNRIRAGTAPFQYQVLSCSVQIIPEPENQFYV